MTNQDNTAIDENTFFQITTKGELYLLLRENEGKSIEGMTAALDDFIQQHTEAAVREARIDEMKSHRHEWELMGDRPPYDGESVSLPFLLAYFADSINDLEASYSKTTIKKLTDGNGSTVKENN